MLLQIVFGILAPSPIYLQFFARFKRLPSCIFGCQEFGTMFVKSPIINFIPWKAELVWEKHALLPRSEVRDGLIIGFDIAPNLNVC